MSVDWDGKECGGLVRHCRADPCREFLNLFPEVQEECITLPSAQKHDRGCSDLGKVEEHGTA